MSRPIIGNTVGTPFKVPTKTSQLENDSGFAYQSTVDTQMESLEERFWDLDGSLLRVSEVANEANTVAKGASKPLVYKNYEIMVNYINSYMNDDIEALRIGWNILIETLNVPDLWVSGISEEQVYYEYISDEQLVADLQNGQVQVGYYLLSPLETQKVPLHEYLKKPTTTGLVRYNADGTVSTLTTYVGVPAQGQIPQAKAGGRITTNTPTEDLDCANKQYVDQLFNSIVNGNEVAY